MAELEQLPLWTEILRLKDELPLGELAQRYQTTPRALSAALERTGAWRLGPTDEGDLPPEPGEASRAVDLHPAARKALSQLREGSKDLRIAPHAALLGRAPDAEVAKAAGVSIRTVASFRARHGIPGYAGPRRRPEPTRVRGSRIDAFAHLLGKVPDVVIAQRAGVTAHAVRAYRAKHGIQGAPTAPASSPTGTGRQAWRVVWTSGQGRRQGVLLAGGLDDAVARVQQAGLVGVLAIELLGSVVED